MFLNIIIFKNFHNYENHKKNQKNIYLRIQLDLKWDKKNSYRFSINKSKYSGKKVVQ